MAETFIIDILKNKATCKQCDLVYTPRKNPATGALIWSCPKCK